MLGVAWDHSLAWRSGAEGWSGRKASAIVEPRAGERVVLRTVWDEIGATVVENRGDVSVLRADRPLGPKCSGSGAWIGEDGIAGIVVAGDAADARTVLVRRPGSAPVGVAMVRRADRAGVLVAANR
jgi:hypothetical protein